MKPLVLIGLLASVAIAATSGISSAGTPDAGTGAWAERVEVIYLSQSRSVERHRVRVWDTHPEMKLDFTWEPAAGAEPGIAADGAISGKGKLVWRVKGSASYDPKTIYSVYSGEMQDGRPNGKGRLEVRTGEVFDGDWVDGRLDGMGFHIDAAGNRYEGAFSAGLPNGEGRYLARNGEVFEGNFVDGLRQGKGRMRLAGGTAYESEWDHDKDVGGPHPDALADATVGGLLKAQSGGGAADKVDIGVVVDQRVTQEAQVPYQHVVRDEDIAIYPQYENMNAAWNGTGPIDFDSFDGVDWNDAPAYVQADIGTSDGSRVKFKGLQLDVQTSQAYRKPMLSLEGHFGCVGFRPDFSFKNSGWGDVKDASISIQFTGEESYNDAGAAGQAAAEQPASRTLTKQLGDFDNGTDVDLEDLLQQAGVDTQQLADARFSCESREQLDACKSQAIGSLKLGEISGFVFGDQTLTTRAKGTLNYSWSDDAGETYQQSEPFSVNISLAYIALPQELAEAGDAFGGSPEAPDYQDVDLPINKDNYTIDLRLRGNKNLANYTAYLKMHAKMSSFHQFQVVATFADGSERRSKTVSLFYFHPKPSNFVSKAKPATACYIPENPY